MQLAAFTHARWRAGQRRLLVQVQVEPKAHRIEAAIRD
jgi:hypothetical protein